MIRVLLLAAGLAFASLAAPLAAAQDAGQAQSLRFDGVYCSEPQRAAGLSEPFRYFLRFYPDATVLYVSATGQPQRIMRWLRKESVSRHRLDHGQFSLSGDRLAFEIETPTGSIDFAGSISGETLTLTGHSHVNQQRQTLSFRFCGSGSDAAPSAQSQ